MKEKFTGCLLGVGVGDALGAAVEFMSLEQIKEKYGDKGIKDFESWGGFEAGSYTDDTQMTLATAQGLIESTEKQNKKGMWKPALLVYKEYLKWLETQENPSQASCLRG
ncbi:MAG TPA: ADP-ribosylglycohydrolase family protein [Acidobacteriota bacterium]|nr:ADP-ribosylglycohydrolase family protein [Acidobacteriota bacterium]